MTQTQPTPRQGLPFSPSLHSGLPLPFPGGVCGAPHFRQWLASTFAPTVLVSGSDLAKRQVAVLTGLTLAGLFEPFGGDTGRRLSAALASIEGNALDAKNSEEEAATAYYAGCRGFYFHPGIPERLQRSTAVKKTPSHRLCQRQSGLLSTAVSEGEERSPFVSESSSSRESFAVPPVSLRTCDAFAFPTSPSVSSGQEAFSATPNNRLKKGAGVLAQELCVRFVNAEEAAAVPALSLDVLASRSLLLSSPTLRATAPLSSLSQDRTSVGASSAESPSPSLFREATELPWFAEWERVIYEGARFSPHETLSQPVAVLAVVSVQDQDPCAEAEALLSASRLPALCQQFVLDPNPVRVCLLLDVHPDALCNVDEEPAESGADCEAHEEGSAAAEASPRAREIFSRLREVLPSANCLFLCLGKGACGSLHRQV